MFRYQVELGNDFLLTAHCWCDRSYITVSLNAGGNRSASAHGRPPLAKLPCHCTQTARATLLNLKLVVSSIHYLTTLSINI